MKRTRDCNVKGNGRQCAGKAEEFKSGMNGVFDNYIKTMNGLYPIVQHKIINLYILYLQFQSIVIGAAGVNGMSARRLVMRDQDRDIAK